MKQCLQQMIVSLLLAGVTSFLIVKPTTTSFSLKGLPENIEVCGFKDCKRAGGGAKLEKLINTVLEENNINDQIKVQGCDCQGECGYGPNILVDGKIVNGVKDKDAIIKALGIITPQESSS